MPRARGRTGPRRPTSWLGSFDNAYITVAVNTAQFITLVAETTLESFPEPTIVRIRGALDVVSGNNGAAGEVSRWGAGIALFTRTAVGIGASALQSPLTDTFWDGWMWWATGVLENGVSNDINDKPAPQSAVQRDIDSKAMRKVGNDEVLCLMFEVSATAGTVDAKFAVATRVLVKR